MESHKILLSFILFSAALLPHFAKADGLENFVRQKMSNYTTWLKTNNYDPSPLVLGASIFNARNNVTRLDVTMFDHGVRGHSDELALTSYNGNLAYGWFNVSFNTTDNITFYGDYMANGTMGSGTRNVVPRGEFFINVPVLHTESFRIDFEVSPGSGYLRLKSHHLQAIRLDLVKEKDRRIHFENLYDEEGAAGNEALIDQALYDGFNMYLHYDQDSAVYPLRSLFLQYWRGILGRTTIGDIIASD